MAKLLFAEHIEVAPNPTLDDAIARLDAALLSATREARLAERAVCVLERVVDMGAHHLGCALHPHHVGDCEVMRYGSPRYTLGTRKEVADGDD